MALTYAHMDRLKRTFSPNVRADIARKVSQGFVHGVLNGKEKAVAIEIFRLLVNDARVRVRKALSESLRQCPDIPRDVAHALARDIEDVALPMLEYSPIFTEAELLEMITGEVGSRKLSAIARRENVSETLSDALLAKNVRDVTEALFRNNRAAISEQSILHSVETMAKDESIIQALLARETLSISCVEKLFLMVSEQMKDQLIASNRISRHLLEGQMEYAREWATLGISYNSHASDVNALVHHLHKKRRLTSSMIIRSLCAGDLAFFEHAMSELTGIPVNNVRTLMLDAGPDGFASLYKLSPLPPHYYKAVKKLLDITWEETENGKTLPDDFNHRVIDNILSNRYDKSVEYMPMLLTIIKGGAEELPLPH